MTAIVHEQAAELEEEDEEEEEDNYSDDDGFEDEVQDGVDL